MKIKKMLAAAVAAIISVSAMAMTASAATSTAQVFTDGAEKGDKESNFADVTFVLSRDAEAVTFDFTGERKLSGHLEIFIDTKECAATREEDATAWRIDLNDDGTIGGTHFAGGELVADGLTYTLSKNDDSGCAATLVIPYSYLGITEAETFGISLGQWSTSANDWDGWDFEGAFVAPETPATYIRVAADATFFRADNNDYVADINVDEAPAADSATDETPAPVVDEAPATEAPAADVTTSAPATGNAAVASIAAVMTVAGAAAIASKKKN